MNRHKEQFEQGHPRSAVTLLPTRWCRGPRSHIVLKLFWVGLASAVLLLVFRAWSESAGQNVWNRWMANFQLSGFTRSNPDATFGHRRQKAEYRDTEPLPAYLGDGRAELGDYSIRVFDPITRATLRTDFHLSGLTSLRDESTFRDFMACNRRFFREQVAVVLRTHHFDGLAAPDLDLLGRKIVARVNRSLGERVLKSAELKGFSLYEATDCSGFVLLEPGEGYGTP